MEVGTDTYVTLEEANTYFSSRLDAAAWDEATDPLKEQALVTATRSLEKEKWVGVIADFNQSLAWPRVGEFFDPRAGATRPLEGVPARVKEAQLELAYHLLQNDGVLDESGSVDEVQVGPIKLKGIAQASSSSSIVYSLVSPLLAVKASGAMWWRAN